MSNPIIFWDNSLLTQGTGTLTATTTATGYDVDNLKDWRTYTLWKGTGTSTQYITKDAGSSFTANTLAIMSHDLKTQNATITVQYSTDNFVTDINDAFTGFIPSSDKIIYKEFTSQTKRYWRLKITSYTAAPYIGILRIGERLVFPLPMDNDGWDSESYKIVSTSQRSQTGNLLGATMDYKQVVLTPKWSFLASSFTDTEDTPGDLRFKTFWDTHASLLKPFFWLWDYSNFPQDIFLVSLPDNFNRQFPYQNSSQTRNVNLELIAIMES